MRDKKNFFVFVFFNVGTLSGVNIFDHCLWSIFQSSIPHYNYNLFKFLFSIYVVTAVALCLETFYFLFIVRKKGFFSTFRRDFQQIPLSVNNLQNVDNHNSFNFTIPNKPLLKFWQKVFTVFENVLYQSCFPINRSKIF